MSTDLSPNQCLALTTWVINIWLMEGRPYSDPINMFLVKLHHFRGDWSDVSAETEPPVIGSEWYLADFLGRLTTVNYVHVFAG